MVEGKFRRDGGGRSGMVVAVTNGSGVAVGGISLSSPIRIGKTGVTMWAIVGRWILMSGPA